MGYSGAAQRVGITLYRTYMVPTMRTVRAPLGLWIVSFNNIDIVPPILYRFGSDEDINSFLVRHGFLDSAQGNIAG